MNIQAVRAVTILVAVVFVFSCSPRPSRVRTGPSSSPEIQAIHVASERDKTVATVVGEAPILYTAFNVEDPDRLVIDLPRMGLGEFTQKVVPESGPILSILPRGDANGSRSQLEITLSQEVETDVRTEGNNLVIEVTHVLPPGRVEPAEAVGAVSEAIPAVPIAPPTALEQMIMPQATAVTEVYFDRGPQAALHLVVTSDGQLSPKHFLLGRDRLVLDLPNVKSRVKLQSVSVKDDAVRQVRIGRHLDKVRLVVDLTQPVVYSIRQDGPRLIVSLRPTSEKISSFHPSIGSDLSAVVVRKAVPAVIPTSVPRPAVTPAAPQVPSAPPTPKDVGGSLPEAKPSPVPTVVADNQDNQGEKRYTGKKISMDFQDAEIAHVLRLIADVSGLNVILADDIKGKVTLKLVDIPWDQAFDMILKTNELGQRREAGIVQVTTLANLTKQQEEEARAKESHVKAEDLMTRILPVNYSKASDLAESLRKSLSPRGDITVDARTNTLIVKDVQRYVDDVARLAKTLDTQTPQVLIEARIVQVAPTFNRSLGIQWGASYQDNVNANRIGLSTGTSGPFGASVPDFAVNLPASPTFGGVGFTFGRLTSNPINLDLRLSAGESQGLTRIVSTPKVTVLDNQEAKIAQGESIPFATTSADGTQTTFVDANLSLRVTPRISPDGSILMKINITKNSPGPVQPGASGPSILKKEASTNVLVKDGETTVIGGIYETSDTSSTSGVPYLMKIPIIGNLFKTTEKRETTSELLVFLTPKVVK